MVSIDEALEGCTEEVKDNVKNVMEQTLNLSLNTLADLNDALARVVDDFHNMDIEKAIMIGLWAAEAGHRLTEIFYEVEEDATRLKTGLRRSFPVWAETYDSERRAKRVSNITFICIASSLFYTVIC